MVTEHIIEGNLPIAVFPQIENYNICMTHQGKTGGNLGISVWYLVKVFITFFYMIQFWQENKILFGAIY